MSENDVAAMKARRYGRPSVGGGPAGAEASRANVAPSWDGWGTTILAIIAVAAIVLFVITLTVLYPTKRDFNGVRFIPENATECTLCPANPPGRPGDVGSTGPTGATGV